MADIMDTVRATLGDKFDAKHVYVVVRPGMETLPKFADCTVVGEFAEDTRNGTRLIVLRRPEPKPPPPSSAAERVRSALGGNHGKAHK